MPWLAKKAMNADRPRMKAAYTETDPGLYDTRDLNAIRAWAVKLADITNSRKDV